VVDWALCITKLNLPQICCLMMLYDVKDIACLSLSMAAAILHDLIKNITSILLNRSANANTGYRDLGA